MPKITKHLKIKFPFEQDLMVHSQWEFVIPSEQGKVLNILESNDRGNKYLDIITKRPKYAELPRFLDKLGSYKLLFLLDFGSFRDIQRHRNGLCRMPILTGDYGFNKWYIEQFQEDMQPEVIEFINSQLELIQELALDKRGGILYT